MTSHVYVGVGQARTYGEDGEWSCRDLVKGERTFALT